MPGRSQALIIGYMSLATTCPQCRTSFKVVPDQLKLRRGQVRCGVCRHVFSGLDSLRYVQPTPPLDPDTPIVIRASTSTSIDAEARPQADPFIDAGSIGPGGAQEPNVEKGESAGNDPLTGPLTGPLTDPLTGLRTGPLTGPLLDPLTGLRTDPLSGPPTEPLVQTFAESDTRPLTDPDTRAFAAPNTEPFDPADTRAFADPDTRTLAAPDTRTLADSDSDSEAFSDDDTRPLPEARDETLAPPGSHVTREEGDTLESPARDFGRGEAFGVARGAQAAQHAPPTMHRALEDDTLRDDETDAVDFFSTQHRTRGFSTRGALLWAFASLVLATVLALQIGIATRDWLASRYPALRPAIGFAIAPLGLAISAPRALEALTIEGFELQSTPVEGLYAMNALLRNGTGHEVRWPAMELTLTEQGGAVVSRKVLMPADYLPGVARRPGADPAPGTSRGPALDRDDGGAPPSAIGPAAEIPLRVALEAAGIMPTGYTVKLFYP